MRDLDRTEIDILLFVSKANSAHGKSGYTKDDEEDSYNCRGFHVLALFQKSCVAVRCVSEHLAIELVNSLSHGLSDTPGGIFSQASSLIRDTFSSEVIVSSNPTNTFLESAG